MRKLLTKISLALMLALPAGLAHANFEGRAADFPQNGPKVASFKSGNYELADGKGNYQNVKIKLLGNGRYEITGSNRDGIATFYPNSSGTLVLSINDGSKYTYFLAKRVKGGVAVLDTAYAASYLLNPKPAKGIPIALEKLPYKDAKKNQAFLRRLAEDGDSGWMRTLFTAKIIK